MISGLNNMSVDFHIPFIDIHSHHSCRCSDVLTIQSFYQFPTDLDSAFISAGMHPWYPYEISFEDIERLLKEDKIIAIGECGLDRLAEVSLQEQIPIFEKQIEFATQYKKPMIIHCVKSFQELIEIKQKTNRDVPMIIHGYNNNWTIAQQLLKHGFYFSFGTALLHKNSNASKVIIECPLEKIFLETDDSGADIKDVFEAAAQHLRMDVLKLKEQIFYNFKQVFQYE